MNKNKILIVILSISIVLVGIAFIISVNRKYDNMVMNSSDWKGIIESRKQSKELKIIELKFNDYDLFIDNDNSAIYYSVVEVRNKLNPSVKYKTNSNAKIAFNSVLEINAMETCEYYKVIVYDKEFYREYALCLTNYPLMNIKGNNIDSDASVKMELFDNHINRPQKYMESDAKFRVEEDRYILRLKKESLGHNKRSNPVSLLGFDKANEFSLEKVFAYDDRKKFVRLFINNKYDDIYYIEPISSGTK